MNAGCGACAGRFGTGPRTLCVRNAADLEPLLKRRPRFDSIRVVAPLPLEDQLRWENRLSELYNECGCSAGSVALLGVLAACGLYALLRPPLPGWRPIVTVLALCFAAAVVEKLIGIAISRVRLNAEVRCLAETLAMRTNAA